MLPVVLPPSTLCASMALVTWSVVGSECEQQAEQLRAQLNERILRWTAVWAP